MAGWRSESKGGAAVAAPAQAAPHESTTLEKGGAQKNAAALALPDLPAEELERRTVLSKKMSNAFGEIVSVLMRSESHRTQMLMDMEWLVVPALATGQFKVAGAQSKAVGYLVPVAVVLWARVSSEIDKRLTANLEQSIRLKPDEWASGDNYWLVEAVGDRRIIGPMLKSLVEQEWKGKKVKFRSRGDKGEAVVRIIEASKDSAPPRSQSA